jgi:hypothetical protein
MLHAAHAQRHCRDGQQKAFACFYEQRGFPKQGLACAKAFKP